MPLSIQHQADSAGDKAVSLIADNSGSNVAAAFKGVNKATQNGDTVADLSVSVAEAKAEDAAHTTGDKGLMALAVRKDTAAALAGTDGDYAPLEVDAVGAVHTRDRAGYADGDTFTRGSSRLLAGLAGIYESTVSTLTAGKVALARLTSRGAVVTGPDWRTAFLYQGGSPSFADITVSTSGLRSGYAAPTAAFFDGSDAGFGAGARYVFVPMAQWSRVGFTLSNQLAVGLTATIYAWWYNIDYASASANIGSQAISAGSEKSFSAYTGTDVVIPALQVPCYGVIIRITPDSDPASGHIAISVVRS